MFWKQSATVKYVVSSSGAPKKAGDAGVNFFNKVKSL